MGMHSGGTVNQRGQAHINILTFRRAFSEFEFCTAEVRHTYGLQDDIGCPACGPEPRSIHLDGNHPKWSNYCWRCLMLFEARPKRVHVGVGERECRYFRV